MSYLKSLSLALACGLVCSVVVAQESDCKNCPASAAASAKCTACPSQTATAVATDEKSCAQCPVTVAMTKLPKMTYKVGDEATCCSESAAALAKKNEAPIHYVVGDKSFEKKEEAYTALVETTEAFVNEFVTPCKCEVSGTTKIADSSCKCPVEAAHKAELVKKAVSEVKMTYVVGDAKCNCPNEAKSMAAKSGEKTTFVVDGKETCCNLEARLNFAKAKYAAAVKALAAAKKTTEETASGTDS